MPSAVRPRDAATLILVQGTGRDARVLMGQRHAGHVFMPNKFVFPGGRVDPGDSRVRPLRGLRPEVEARVSHGCTRVRARALAMAAVRETFEETGLLVGQRTQAAARTRSRSWAPFFAEGVEPDLAALDFIARAITPPDSPRRFDARFFMASADCVQGDAHESLEGSGELLDLHWVKLGDAPGLDLPEVTRLVIDQVARRAALTPAESRQLPVPFFHWRNRKSAYDELT